MPVQSAQKVKPYGQPQGTRERIPYALDWAPAPCVQSPSVYIVYAGSNVTTNHMTGAASVVGAIVYLPQIHSLCVDKPVTVYIGAITNSGERWVEQVINPFPQEFGQ